MIYGKGLNDLKEKTERVVSGKRVRCPYYLTWNNMLRRCYSGHVKSHIGCQVSDVWLSRSNFTQWMRAQDCQNKHLDKDIFGDGMLYSPETCCFVEQWLNNLFLDSGAKRGESPIGTHYNTKSGVYMASIRIDNKLRHLGCFGSSEEGHLVYLKAKRKYVRDKMHNYPDPRIRHAVLKKAKELYEET